MTTRPRRQARQRASSFPSCDFGEVVMLSNAMRPAPALASAAGGGWFVAEEAHE